MMATDAIEIDLWDDAGPFLYRHLPETCLSDFFTEERDMIQITRDLGKWWIGQTGVMGQSPYDDLDDAKRAADAEISEMETGQAARLLAEAGLDPSEWSIDLSDGITFEHQTDPISIIGDTGDIPPGRQSWSVIRADSEIACGCETVAAALIAIKA